jgi:hypothetical protein
MGLDGQPERRTSRDLNGLLTCRMRWHYKHAEPSGHRCPAHLTQPGRYAEWMTVRELLAGLQHLPRDLEVLAFEAGCEEYCAREVDELELHGGRVYLHLGVRRDEPPRR